ncbi:MAG: HAD-IIIA family hydrolase [Bryobacteraceae bacterium]|nr:HAD-IIIA family hydrolase [Bryobacteraceae bacterium]
MHYDLVIFDLDGTLIDSRLDLAHSVNATRTHMGLELLPHERIYSYVGNGAPVLIQRALGPGVSEAEVERALQYFLAWYREHKLDFTTLYPDVRETLRSLAASHVRMAILTNKPINITREILSALEIDSCFFQVYGGNSFEQKKPDPAGIYKLLEEANLTADRAVMVGDSDVDIRTARNAGVAAVGCTWGFKPESLETEPPDWLIDRMADLPRVLQSAAVARTDVTI